MTCLLRLEDAPSLCPIPVPLLCALSPCPASLCPLPKSCPSLSSEPLVQLVPAGRCMYVQPALPSTLCLRPWDQRSPAPLRAVPPQQSVRRHWSENTLRKGGASGQHARLHGSLVLNSVSQSLTLCLR